ncbi:hypothetical protein PN498_14695 [Oscillatoria sp. CS-180]|uniref:hypothetical protein n=1 Tax=Oscillatoria sp. CS-180 TaxID=3021720 RepID=UPI00232D934A|nr:hypothetical protein [Oscillatoria sp. CS-180]MDB9527245.1 hypothetical protein [Oscillatoria sp. CS-180]
MTFALPPDDQPPASTTDLDATLRRRLELSMRKHFFEACDGSMQSLLMECSWTINIAEVLMLVIHCPDATTNWRVLNGMAQIAEFLAQTSPLAKIRVYPPMGMGGPFDMRVNERSEYRVSVNE